MLNSHNQQSQSAVMAPVKVSAPESRVPEVQYPEPGDPTIDFQLESYKLVQANAVLADLVKQAINDKYSISEKIIRVSEQIKKLEAKNLK